MSAEDTAALEELAGKQETCSRLILNLAEQIIELQAAVHAQQGVLAAYISILGSNPAEFKAAVEAKLASIHEQLDTKWKARLVQLGLVLPAAEDPFWERWNALTANPADLITFPVNNPPSNPTENPNQ